LAKVYAVVAASSAQALRPKIIVTGASSQIGVFAIPRLLVAGFDVVAISRQKKLACLPDSEHLSWYEMEEALQTQSGFEYLFSAGPMKLALDVLQKSVGIKRAVIFSSSSVIAKLESADAAERQLMQQMLASESELEALAKQLEIKLTIFRPTLVYGCGLDGNVSRLAGIIKRFSFMPVNGKADGLRQPVHADDLAAVAILVLQTQAQIPEKLILAGGSTITYREMLQAIFHALDKPARILPLPHWVLIPAVKFMTFVGLNAGVNSAMVKRQRQDLQFNDHPARQLLGYQPRAFAPTIQDFELPDFSKRPAD
jgi:nucleoside-diphosphate-sugar epimerase